MRTSDPGRMSPEAIVAELGELLATGFQRHIAKEMCHPDEGKDPEKDLDEPFAFEARCGEPEENTT